MHSLVFNTPSKSCGAKVFNGEKVTILPPRYRRKVRRLGGRYANIFMVYSEAHDTTWWAIEDELFIEAEAP